MRGYFPNCRLPSAPPPAARGPCFAIIWNPADVCFGNDKKTAYLQFSCYIGFESCRYSLLLRLTVFNKYAHPFTPLVIYCLTLYWSMCTNVMCAVQLATRMYTLCLYTDIRAVVCVDVMCSCWPHRQRSDARTGKPGVWSQVMALPRPHRPQLLNMRRLLTVGLSENCSTTDLFLFRSDPILRWENLTILHVSKNIAWFWGPDDELLLWKCVFENKFTRILNLNGKIGDYFYWLLSALSG